MLVSCFEPDGEKLRRVHPMMRSPEEIAMILRATDGVPSMFSGQGCFHSMDELFDEEKIFLLVDKVGLICFVPDLDNGAHVHITFWDKRLRGRELLCKAVAREMMLLRRFDKLWTIIPRTSRPTLAFTKRLGFKEVEFPRKDLAFLQLTKEDFHGA
jgi:hypothetical protein